MPLSTSATPIERERQGVSIATLKGDVWWWGIVAHTIQMTKQLFVNLIITKIN
jgi:hypothetical protein